MSRSGELVTTVVDETYIESMKRFEAKPEGESLFEACSKNIVLFS
jgi:hypothetical protein